MSPEQVTAGRIPVDHRTDIYSLGATLYELLTLRPPFRGDGRDQLLAQVIQKEPPKPRSIDPRIPRDLETICLKCLDKDPDRRYATAQELADDLRRFVNRFAILAKRTGPLGRAKRWAKRNPWVAGLAALVLALTGIAGYFAWRAHETEQQRQADEQRREEEIRVQQRQTALDKAVVEAMGGDAPAALKAISEAERLGAEPGQLNMTRGIVELQRGRYKEATVYLDQAHQQMPGSVAVKALLGSAGLVSGHFASYTDLITVAERLGPKTPEDFIFLGQALAVADARRGLAMLDRAPAAARRSPVARLCRAVIQARYAMDTGTIEDAELALKDIDRAELPDNPLLISVQVEALLAAAHARGKDRAAEGYRQQAGEIAKRLAAYSDRPVAVQSQCYYFLVTDDDDSLLRVVREAPEANVGRTPVYAPYVLYRRKRFEEAVTAAAQSRESIFLSVKVGQFLALATLGRTDEARVVLQKALDIRREMSVGLLHGFWYFLGPEAGFDPRRRVLAVLDRVAVKVPDWRDGWYRDALQYNAGNLSADELITRAGASRMNQCEGFFYIGLHKLHEHKRAEAKQWFQRSLDTGVFIYDEYLWSKAFLASIDDPIWLPWTMDK